MTDPNDYNDLADYEWLTGPEAATIAADLSTNSAPLHRVVERLRRTLSASRAHLVVELVELRRRGAAKFQDAGRMFFTRTALEQATDQWVAAYKAARFPTNKPLADLCCGIGGDALALAAREAMVGVDRDPIVLHLAAANARATLKSPQAKRAEFRAADIERCDLSGVAAWHIDPDRRSTGQRTSALVWCSPNLQVIEQLLNVAASAAVKLAPAARVPERWTDTCELEWISRDGECRQLVAWHGRLADTPGQRRATILIRPAQDVGRIAPRTIVGTANQTLPVVSAIERYVFDIDTAVLAAHLKGVLAAAHDLGGLAAGSSYLTGPAAIDDPALACFEVVDVMPPRATALASYFRDHKIGQLEIKKRGVDIDPERLRRDLKLRGDNAAVLLLTSVQGRPTAIVARRVNSTGIRALPRP